VEYVSQSRRVEDSQHVRGISGLHLVRVSDGPLKYDSASGCKNDDEDQEYDAGFDRSYGLPSFMNKGT
jgi:hypothetical protein